MGGRRGRLPGRRHHSRQEVQLEDGQELPGQELRRRAGVPELPLRSVRQQVRARQDDPEASGHDGLRDEPVHPQGSQDRRHQEDLAHVIDRRRRQEETGGARKCLPLFLFLCYR